MVSNPDEWVVDTGASRHFCNDKSMFKTFNPITEGEQVFMGNSSVSEVSGKGKIELMLYSGKKLMLRDVLYVPSLRRNLISGALLNKAGIKLVFESNRLIMTLCGQFLGKGYLRGGLFVLDISVIRNPPAVEGPPSTIYAATATAASTSANRASVTGRHLKLHSLPFSKAAKPRPSDLIPDW
nr:Retrovirus-related Pol polyprotein from transposon TNT 1-94 [Ipomoea batatas]